MTWWTLTGAKRWVTMTRLQQYHWRVFSTAVLPMSKSGKVCCYLCTEDLKVKWDCIKDGHWVWFGDRLTDEVRQECPWTMMFADDIVICSESRQQLEETLERWRFALERTGMKFKTLIFISRTYNLLQANWFQCCNMKAYCLINLCYRLGGQRTPLPTGPSIDRKNECFNV